MVGSYSFDLQTWPLFCRFMGQPYIHDGCRQVHRKCFSPKTFSQKKTRGPYTKWALLGNFTNGPEGPRQTRTGQGRVGQVRLGLVRWIGHEMLARRAQGKLSLHRLVYGPLVFFGESVFCENDFRWTCPQPLKHADGHFRWSEQVTLEVILSIN